MNLARTALNIGSVILVAVLGWLIVRSVMGILSPESLYAPAVVVKPAAGGAQAAVTRNYDFSSDPFALGEIAPIEVDLGETAPETTLDLKLTGTITGPDGTATLRRSGAKDESYSIDEEVMNGVTLRAIARDFVMLDVNGEMQKLTLERVKNEQSQTNGARITRAAVKPSGSGAAMPTKAEVESLFKSISITPNMEKQNGKSRMTGYKVSPKGNADLSKYGLRNGDVLTRIGPVPLNTSRVNIAELTDLLSTGEAQDIEVLRGGSPVIIRIGQ